MSLLAAAGCAPAAVPRPAPAPATAPAPASAPASAPATQPSDPVADALFELLRARHADKLGPADLAALRKQTVEIVKASTALRGVRLPNDAEPHGGIIANPGRVS